MKKNHIHAKSQYTIPNPLEYNNYNEQEQSEELDDDNRDIIINQLKEHLIELENNNRFVEELRTKFASLQNEFKNLSLVKKKIELDLNQQIYNLQEENKNLTSKYHNLKEKMNTILSSHSDEINKLKNINEIKKKDNEDLLKENKKLNDKINVNSGIDCDDSNKFNILFYQKQLEESNKSIMKLNNLIKNLEEKNQSILNNYMNNNTQLNNDNNSVIVGLRKVIEDKEKFINNLYSNYDTVKCKCNVLEKENQSLKNEVNMLRNKINDLSNPFNFSSKKLDINGEVESKEKEKSIDEGNYNKSVNDKK